MNTLDEFVLKMFYVVIAFQGLIGIILMYNIMSIKNDIEFLEYLIKEIRRCVNR